MSQCRHASLFDQIECELLNNPAISLVRLAKNLGTDRHNIEYAVKCCRNITFHRFKKQRQLQSATQLLVQGLSVTEVAITLGFRSHSAFSRFFKASTGTVPSVRRVGPASP